MRTLKTREAAELLNVSASTLRTWERKFGYPKPQRSPGGHRVFAYAEVEALRDALREGLSVSSAISVASEGLGADVRALVAALASFAPERADRALEVSLGLRSMEGTIEDILLPALDEIRRREGAASVTWAFAFRWATDWLARMQRLVSSPARGRGVLVGDASGRELDLSVPHIRALELLCAREGCNVVSLPAGASTGLPRALEALHPKCVVLAGHGAPDDEAARWARAVQSTARVPILLYLRMVASQGTPPDANVLASSPIQACRQIVEAVDSDGVERRLSLAARGRR